MDRTHFVLAVSLPALVKNARTGHPQLRFLEKKEIETESRVTRHGPRTVEAKIRELEW
jgi:hypothetical protein